MSMRNEKSGETTGQGKGKWDFMYTVSFIIFAVLLSLYLVYAPLIEG